MLVDEQSPDSFLATSGAFVSPAVRVVSVLKGVRPAAWVTVKILFVMIAAPLILLFAIASFGAMFAGFHW
jgi:K+ transporter